MLPEPAYTITNELLLEINKANAGYIQGFYITGSLALNDFFPKKSDIDFVIFCRYFPDAKMKQVLESIHRRIHKRWPKPDLSGIYTTQENLYAEHISAIKVLSYHVGIMRFDTFEMAPVTFKELKSSAVTVSGAPASELPVNIDPGQLRTFMHQNLNNYWRLWVDAHSNWFRKKILLFCFPRFTEWVLLGIARQWYTLRTGMITSKTHAGEYVLKLLPEDLRGVLHKAVAIRHDERSYPLVRTYALRPSFSRMSQTLACARFMMERFNEEYKRQE